MAAVLHQAALSLLAPSNTEFALNLYRLILKQSGVDTNVFFSPFSVSMALAMTFLGAQNNTKNQMKLAMAFGDLKDDDIHQTFQAIQSSLTKEGKPYTLHVANRLFVDSKYNFLEQFLTSVKELYGGKAEMKNFQQEFEAARMNINSWVEKKTKSKIKDLLPPGSLDPLTRLVLVNAIYFKGDWADQFDPKNTEKMDFYSSNGSTKQVDMMHMKKKVVYGETSNYQILGLPYAGGELTFFALLPTAKDGLKQMVESLKIEDLMNVENHSRRIEVKVYLPKFELEQTSNMKQLLVDLGMSDLFIEGKSDLSGIDGSHDLYVSEVYHKAYIKVNEEGSEAAAATGVVMNFRSMPMSPKQFKADHPFLFFLRDNTTKSILFVGSFADPEDMKRDEL